MDDPELDELDDLEPTYDLFTQRTRAIRLAAPVVLLFVVIAIVSGLVFGGVVQGHQTRTGPSEAPTTESTVIISP